jgi:hypothetical protein
MAEHMREEGSYPAREVREKLGDQFFVKSLQELISGGQHSLLRATPLMTKRPPIRPYFFQVPYHLSMMLNWEPSLHHLSCQWDKQQLYHSI